MWQPVVRELSFELRPHETLAIVGESGSGKSVTALAMMQLISRVSGRAEGAANMGGRNLLLLSEEEMQAIRGSEIGMIFQEPMTSLNPVLTIGEQIAESLRYHRGLTGADAEAEVVRILDRVRIPAARERLREYPHRFSGGMRQRVMIAMALACQPKVLIADEPTTALDVTVQAQILDLIKSLQAELGMAVIFITHDMGVVAEVADRTLVMWRGRKVEEGDTTSVFRRPCQPYTRALLGAVPTLGSMRGERCPRKLPVLDPHTGSLIDDVLPVPGGERPAPRAECAPPLLEVRDLCTRFDVRGGLLGTVNGRVHAVQNVSFTLGVGETLSLVGESGCGKSTTGRSVLRLVEPTSGSVRFEGSNVLDLDRRGLRRLRRRMQMIFQDPYASLDPRLRVGIAIAEPMIVHRLATRNDASDRVALLLRKVGLSPDMAHRFPHEFSGGQRQRLCIARALSLMPALVVADEAVSSLDVSIKAQVLNLLIDLQQELGLSYLFISHDMAIVERVSHRIAVMYVGEIVEVGPRDEILGNPQHPYTRKLISAVPIPDPSRRASRRALPAEDLPSPLRPPHYHPPARQWREVSHGHLVQEVA
jgi:peptide/nickel transport system ATP-binding protein